MANVTSQTIPVRSASSSILGRFLGVYLRQSARVWNHLPASLRHSSTGRAYGKHLHALVLLQNERRQSFGTFFLRNRPELELMRRLLNQKAPGSRLDISVLACSKGAEVYSVLWAIRSARPDLKLNTHALDISQEILEFAERGVYSRIARDISTPSPHNGTKVVEDVAWNTSRDQNAPIFERMTDEEVNAMFEVEGDQAKVRPWLKEGIKWLRGDANDPKLLGVLGPQEIVVANRFLCHMQPAAADKCLRSVARLVKPGGYLFVSGIDLDVRTRVARDLRWKPVTELIREIHDGDTSLRRGWPLEYWGLEPFSEDQADWGIRYASVFQIGEAS
ncbi:MAG: CheR family methyltransferase [Halobacteriota archaeon]